MTTSDTARIAEVLAEHAEHVTEWTEEVGDE